MPPPEDSLCGTLHLFVAFDWGDEIFLDKVAQAAPASLVVLPRRRRTPSSFSFHPSPLRLTLAVSPAGLPVPAEATVGAELTFFDFGAVSLALHVPLALPRSEWLRLADALGDPAAVVSKACDVLQPLHQQVLPAIKDPSWHENLSEEYFVFQFPGADVSASSDEEFLAALVHLEKQPLSQEEKREATRLRLSYSPDDLFVPDWPAAVLFDQDCGETLQVIEFANLQLLEFRHIDNRLDGSLSIAGKTMERLVRSYLPFWRGYSRPLRQVGKLKVEANDLFERTGNALKLVGDPYLARAYRLLSTRFHLETWENSIRGKLEVLEGVYQTVADQASHFRTEFLELTVVLLIVLEVVLALFVH